MALKQTNLLAYESIASAKSQWLNVRANYFENDASWLIIENDWFLNW